MNKDDHRNPGNGRIALRYAERGFRISPLHRIKDGSCTCRDPACDRPGRHPCSGEGSEDATSDLPTVRRLWAKWPKAKIGIALGGAKKFLSLVTENEDARRRLQKFIAAHGKFPTTVTIKDGDRCISLLRGDGRPLRNDLLAEGVRILGEGFTIAPSRFASSGKRRFVNGFSVEDVMVAKAPEWLLEICAKAPAPLDPLQMEPVIVRSSEIEPKAIRWIWPSVIASGSVTALVGDPGLGKSQVAMDIAATISTGRNWPGAIANDSASDVIILSAEHDLRDTVVPRLIAANADRTRIHLVAVNDDSGIERAFNLVVGQFALHQVRLLVIDPVGTSTNGKQANRSNAADTSNIVARLSTFADQHELGVLLISHLNTTRAVRTSTWIKGCRIVFRVTEEPGTGRRLFLSDTAPHRIGYAFTIVSKIVGEGIHSSAMVWSENPIAVSDDPILLAAKRRLSPADFLQELLSRRGPMPASEAMRLGWEAGYSAKSLAKARAKSGATSTRTGGIGAHGKWIWARP